MEPFNLLTYVRDFALPVALLIIFCGVLYRLLRREQIQHQQTRERLNQIRERLEQRLYHELDELEKILREERTRLK